MDYPSLRRLGLFFLSLAAPLGLGCTDESPATSDGDGDTTGGGDTTGDSDATGDGCEGGCETPPEPDWSHSYGGEAHGRDEAFAVAIDPTGRIVVVGVEEDADRRFGMLILSLSPDGDALWRRRIDAGPGLESLLRDVVVDGDGNIFAAGWDASRHGTVRRFDRDGGDVWTYTAAAPDGGTSGASALVLAYEGLYSLSDEFEEAEGTRMVLRRHDPATGEPAWTTSPAAPEWSPRGYGLAATGARIIVAGGAHMSSGGKEHPLTAVFSPGGVLESLVTEADTPGSWHAAAAIGDGDVVLTGWLGRESAARRLGPDGGVRWTQLLGPSDFGYGGLGVAVGPDQSVVIAGSRGHDGPPYEDLHMARLGEDGAPLWTALYDNPEFGLADRGYDAAFGPGFFVVVGFETVGISDTDLWIRRFAG